MMMGEEIKPGSLVTSFQDVRESTGRTKPTFLPVLAEVLLWFFLGDFLFTTNVKHTKPHEPSGTVKVKEFTLDRI